METFDTFAAAQEKCDEGSTVCGTYIDKRPQYFLMPAEATEQETRDRAFEVREGRPPSEYEKFILSLAMAGAE